MKYIRPILILIVALMLAACGGGGDGGGGTSSPAATVDPAGIYAGTVTENGVGSFNVLGLVHNGRLIFYSETEGTLYDGTLSVSGSHFTATTHDYQMGGGFYATSRLTGTVVARSAMNGSYTSSNGGSGSFTLAYDAARYERGSSAAMVAGIWMETNGTATTTVTVSADGSYFGSDTNGCVYSGTLVPASTAINIYTVTVNVTSCGAYDGHYTGYASTGDGARANDTLAVSVSNANYISLGFFTRQ